MSETPAQEFRDVAGRFGDVVSGVRPDQWDDPSPVEEWTARDVVGHLVEWFPSFLSDGAGVDLPPGPPVDEDPAGAWRNLYDEVLALLDDPATSGRVLSNPRAWDLARASGQDATLDPGRCAARLAGAEPYEDAMRQSGQYGPRVEVPEDADAQTKLLGFIGRDPFWAPDSSAG